MLFVIQNVDETISMNSQVSISYIAIFVRKYDFMINRPLDWTFNCIICECLLSVQCLSE